MTLGRTLVDRQGDGHAMAGLLPIVTSFAEPKLHLGYRQIDLLARCPLGSAGAAWRGHEFHALELEGEGPALSAPAPRAARREGARSPQRQRRRLVPALDRPRRPSRAPTHCRLATDAGTRECRHARVAGDGGTDDVDGECRTRGFAQPHAEVEQRPRSARAAAGGRARPSNGQPGNGRRRRVSLPGAERPDRGREAVEEHRHVPQAGCQMAPTMAASSRPPTWRKISSGSVIALR